MASALLSQAPVTTILPVKDMERARRFYEGKLGLRPEGPKADGKFVYRLGSGAILALFPKEGGTKADHTALSFQVRDIQEGIRTLESAGVVFEPVSSLTLSLDYWNIRLKDQLNSLAEQTLFGNFAKYRDLFVYDAGGTNLLYVLAITVNPG